MRFAIVAALWLAAAAGAVQAQPRPPAPATASVAAPPQPNMEVMLSMRDGVKLAADVYLPQGPGPWPVIVTRTPYGKTNMFRAGGGPHLVQAGYAYVV